MEAYSTATTARRRRELPDMKMKGGLHRERGQAWGASFSGTDPEGRRYTLILSHEECMDILKAAVSADPQMVRDALAAS